MHVGDHGEVIGVGDETITVWDPTTGRVTATVPLTVPVLDIGDTVQIGFHPITFGGTLVAWLGTDSVVRLVDLAGTPPTAHEIGPGRGTPPPSIAPAGGSPYPDPAERSRCTRCPSSG